MESSRFYHQISNVIPYVRPLCRQHGNRRTNEHIDGADWQWAYWNRNKRNMELRFRLLSNRRIECIFHRNPKCVMSLHKLWMQICSRNAKVMTRYVYLCTIRYLLRLPSWTLNSIKKPHIHIHRRKFLENHFSALLPPCRQTGIGQTRNLWVDSPFLFFAEQCFDLHVNATASNATTSFRGCQLFARTTLDALSC